MIKNISQGILISKNAHLAQNLLDKTLGMLLVRNTGGLVFNTRFGIHTFFMKGKIDLLVLNKERRVVRLIYGLPPNKFFIWNPKYPYVLELPSGSIKKTKMKLGDKLDF